MSTRIPESQAHNFISGAQEGIDPRTGLFSFSFPLAGLSASGNQAPFLPLTLSWSALQTDKRCHGGECQRHRGGNQPRCAAGSGR